MILSTLAELEVPKDEEEKNIETILDTKQSIDKVEVQPVGQESKEENNTCSTSEDERHFCESMRERILVLFEGFQSPNNKSIEAKVDLTLNFLEYLLAVIDERLESLDKK